MSSFRVIGLLMLLVSMTACGDNLLPSGEDKRPSIQAGSIGANVSQKAPDFSITDSNGATVTLASSLAGKKGAVFYFNMWCPTCDSHTNNMRASITPSFSDVNFYLVDYVTGSVTGAARAASENGYSGGVFTILADTDRTLLNNFQAAMGTTVVLDGTGTVLMNEEYKEFKLQSILAALP